MALNDEQVEKLRSVMSTVGWREIVVPVAENRIREISKLLMLFPSERPEPYKSLPEHLADHILRSEAKGVEWLIFSLRNEVAAYDFNRRRDELDRQADPNGSAHPLTPANP